MDDDDDGARPLAESLLLAIADLLFCPDFTVQSHKRGGPVRTKTTICYRSDNFVCGMRKYSEVRGKESEGGEAL